MNQYVVGGCVRDCLLGLDPKDIDFVWTGVTPDYLLQKGLKQVGNDFPVFLDDEGREHALARVETKIGEGYHGFSCKFDPSITLEDDLFRRDLTINSLAVRIEDWETFKVTKDSSLVIDAFGGVKDLQQGLIKHVSEHFAEDPVRVLRAARFAARYGFEIAPPTLGLMKRLVNSGELNHLTAERVWMEIEKAMMDNDPSTFFKVLMECEALKVVAPEFVYNEKMHYIHKDILHHFDLEQRFAAATLYMSPKSTENFFDNLKSPANFKKVAIKVKLAYTFMSFIELDNLSAKLLVHILDVINAYKQPFIIDTIQLFQFSPISKIRKCADLLAFTYEHTHKISFADLGEEGQKLKGAEISSAIMLKRVEVLQALL